MIKLTLDFSIIVKKNPINDEKVAKEKKINNKKNTLYSINIPSGLNVLRLLIEDRLILPVPNMHKIASHYND